MYNYVREKTNLQWSRILLTIGLMLLTFTQATAQQETNFVVVWGRVDSTYKSLVVKVNDSITFTWEGLDSVAYILDPPENLKCNEGIITNATLLGRESPVSINITDIPSNVNEVIFASAEAGKCPGEYVRATIDRSVEGDDIEIQKEKAEEQRWVYAVFFGLLLLTQFTSYMIKQLNIYIISDAAATIAIGAVASGIYHLVLDKTKSFFSNFGSIFMYAIMGCLVSSLVTGGIMFSVSQIPFLTRVKPWSLYESLVFGSLISSTDPVATLAIFSSLNADDTLYGLVFGESVMNDAVSILLYRVLQSFEEDSFGSHKLPGAIGMFFVVFFGSLLFGMITSMLLSLLMKHSRIQNQPSMEILVLLLVGYSCYIISELILLSGIVAIFFYGCGCRHYTYYNLSKSSTDGSLLLFRVLSDASETFVFLYLGLSFFPLAQGYRPGYILFAILAVLIGRAVNIFPISMLVNLFRVKKVTFKMQMMLFHAGLRGAVAYALATDVDQDGSRGIRSTTQVVVLFTVVVLGGSTAPLLKSLRLTKDDTRDLVSSSNEKGYVQVLDSDRETPTPDPIELETNEIVGEPPIPVSISAPRKWWGKYIIGNPTQHSKVADLLSAFDNNYVIPLLTKKPSPLLSVSQERGLLRENGWFSEVKSLSDEDVDMESIRPFDE
eukprot:Ihof_evm9s50 gene=Ihof_evmTU9s50